MKILLDECVTKHLKPHLKGHEVFTVRELNFGGIKNGKLMGLCDENQFDILLTIDKNLQFQQNPAKFAVSIIILNCLTSTIEELIAFLPALFRQLENIERGKAYLLNK